MPVINDIVLFDFNDSNYAKESIVRKLGRVPRVEKTKVSIQYSMKVNGDEQILVRSLRDISIVYSVEEMMVNTIDHFNECSKSTKTSEN